MPDKTPRRPSATKKKKNAPLPATAPAWPPAHESESPPLPAAQSAAPPDPNSAVILRAPEVAELFVRDTKPLAHLSRYWSYVIGNRMRFTEESRPELQGKALRELNEIGLSTEGLRRLVQTGVVEVSMPFEAEERMWETRIFPWEGLLSLATKSLRRNDQPFTVVRHLRRPTRLMTAAAIPQKLLLVTSAPGRLAAFFDFTHETRLIENAFMEQMTPDNIRRLKDPSLAELADGVREFSPDVIHLSGIDTHQAAALLREPDDRRRRDGFILRGPDNQPLAARADEIAPALTAADQAPRLVAFNCYNSGARLAALAVARGATASLGFQDTIDDTVAEQFFCNFYTVWRRFGWEQILEAFTLSRHQIAETTESRNMGDIVLWNDTSVFKTPNRIRVGRLAQVAAKAFEAAQPWLSAVTAEFTGSNVVRPDAPLGSPPPASPSAPLAPDVPAPAASAPPFASSGPTVSPFPAPPTGAVFPFPAPPAVPRAPSIRCEITPLEHLNYSLLHNKRSLFRRFQLEVDEEDLPLAVEVEVQLFASEHAFKSRSRHRIATSITNLHEDIYLPLVAPMLRGRRESITTVLSAEVFANGQSIHCETHPVRLLPPDEWTDNPQDRRWLPSFVLPRDPAVQRIFESAQRYLRALADDSDAEFDGYQRVEGRLDDPEGIIDLQVRALWSALLYEHPLAYINPPPTYTLDAQRIRTPSQMLEERRGTCIDLALLFTGCLEYLGLMPVMFLIHGHAFPGYWRTREAQKRFWKFGNVTAPPEANAAAATSGGTMIQEGWMVEGVEGLIEITHAIQSGGLVPIETTSITRQASFRAAQEYGIKNLMTPWGFDAMVDLQTARDRGVTPLPLLHLDT